MTHNTSYNISHHKEAYVTLVTSNDFVIAAQVLIYSLDQSNPSDSRVIICLITCDVNESSRCQLISAGYELILIDPIPCPYTNVHVSSWYDVGLSKLRIWQLTQFARILYIDADCIVTGYIGDVFERHVDFAAAPDTFPPDHFNAGVMLIKPSQQLFGSLMRSICCMSSYDGGDTGFLNCYFRDWYSSPSLNRLPFAYNALRTMYWMTRKQPNYWKSIEPIKIIHYCSSPKPWQNRNAATGELEQLWWQYHDAMIATQNTHLSANIALTITTLAQLNNDESTINSCLSFVDFNESMSIRPVKFGHWSKNDEMWLSCLQTLYNKACQTHATAAAPLIPLRIHQIWLASPVPAIFDKWRNSWKNFSKRQWQYHLYTDDDLQHFPFSANQFHHIDEENRENWISSLRSLMNNATNPAEKSDIFRLDLLFAFGGVYVDIDFSCENQMAIEQLHYSFDLYTGLSNTGTVEINNALIGCKQNHPLIRQCLEKLIGTANIDTSSSEKDIINRVGPGFFTRQLLSSLLNNNSSNFEHAIVFPLSYFYPFPNVLRGIKSDNDKQLFIRKETLAVHHWSCSWQKKQFKSDVEHDKNVNVTSISSLNSALLQKITGFL